MGINVSMVNVEMTLQRGLKETEGASEALPSSLTHDEPNTNPYPLPALPRNLPTPTASSFPIIMHTLRSHSSTLIRYFPHCASYSTTPLSATAPLSSRQRPKVNFSSSRSDKFAGHTIGTPSGFPVLPGKLSPTLAVPSHIPRPPYAVSGVPPNPLFQSVVIHDVDGISKMRAAGQIARKVLDVACQSALPGMTTDEVDIIVHNAICEYDAYPSPLNYHGFPKSVCSSVNEVICHGIPDSRVLLNGDIVSFDVSCFFGGVHGDNCGTVCVGEVDDAGVRLVNAAKEALDAGVAAAGPGRCLTEVGAAIHDVCDNYGYDSVRKYCGHGVFEDFHTEPYVKHFRNRDTLRLLPGMIFTIEPMVTEGSQSSITWKDNWTAATVDGGRAAQFEHTILITETGVEILTVNPDESKSKGG